MPLTWTPPRSTYDVVVDLGAAITRTFEDAEYVGKHILVIPKTTLDTDRGLLFNGAASVTIIGGQFRPAGRTTWTDGSFAAASLMFSNCGEVYLEGIHLDHITLGLFDAIQVVAVTALTTVTIQNCRFDNIQGFESDTHGDVFQTGSSNMGKTGPVRIDHLTANCSYNGIFIDPQNSGAQGGGLTSVILNNVNIRRNGTLTERLFFFYATAAKYTSDGYPITLNNCWGDPGPGQLVERDVVWPANTAATHPNFMNVKYAAVRATDVALGRAYCHYPGLTDAGKVLSGRIYEGAPPLGDFVPANRVGLGYVQGSDLDQPAGTTSAANLLAVGSGTWTTGGTGSVTIDARTGSIQITSTGNRTFARRSIGVAANRKYWLTYSSDTATAIFRQIGTAAGGETVVAMAASSFNDNKIEFVPTTTTIWVEFSLTSVGTATASSFILEQVPVGTIVGRRSNARSQIFRLDAYAAGLRTANHTLFIGGWIKCSYVPAAGIYFMDFGRSDLGGSGGGSYRVRMFWDPLSNKLAASNMAVSTSVYCESYITTTIQPNVWYYIGCSLAVNGIPKVNINKIRATAQTGTAPSVSNDEVCRVLCLGARAVPNTSSIAPVAYANWIWCSGFLPTVDQVDALADGFAPDDVPGLVPTCYWPMIETGITEPSVATAGTFTVVDSPVTVVGPQVVPPTPPVIGGFPLDIIII